MFAALALLLVFWVVYRATRPALHGVLVREITMRTTRLRTLNNTWVIVPNEAVINRTLVRHSTKGNVRLQVPAGTAYKESLDDAREAILRAVKKVLGDPAPGVVAAALGDSSRSDCPCVVADAGDEKPTYFKIVEAAKKALDEASIEIPFRICSCLSNRWKLVCGKARSG